MLRTSFSIRTLLLATAILAIAFWYCWVPTETDRVFHWLVTQDHETLSYVWDVESAFALEMTPVAEEVFDELFVVSDPDLKGHSFFHLAKDHSGGHFLLWKRAQTRAPPAVVYVSTPDYGVVAKSFLDFPEILAHGVDFEPFWHPPTIENWRSAKPDSHADLLRDQVLREFQQAVVRRFGQLRPLDELLADRAGINKELSDWVTQSHAASRESLLRQLRKRNRVAGA